MKRIFVRGLSRSGGTLMVTVLDAHPDVAMCYETYEHLLEPQDSVGGGADDGGNDGIGAFAACIDAEPPRRRWWSRRPAAAATAVASPRLEKFAARALRAGVDRATLGRLLHEHVSAGRTFRTFPERMAFVESIAQEKREREGKRHWGMKVASTYEPLVELYDDPYFLFMVRDGRDIAASRKHTGNFEQAPEDVASGWVKQVESFRRFAARYGERAGTVRYETLTSDPEAELHRVAERLDLPWSDDLVAFHRKDLSLYRNPTGHLSSDQVNKPISTASVGRWRKDLTASEVTAFEAIAGDLLDDLGYDRS